MSGGWARLLGIAGVVAVGCASGGSADLGEPCESSDDCRGGARCVDRICVATGDAAPARDARVPDAGGRTDGGTVADGAPVPADAAAVARPVGETDVDCGGWRCPACSDGRGCAIDDDCEGRLCSAMTCTRPAATCANGARDGMETDVDCGGPACAGCEAGRACSGFADCASRVCAAGACAAASCSDAVRNGDETDVDCGGETCGDCAVGRGCARPRDCSSRRCADGLCAAPSCSDGVRNGDETDVDCGGGCAGCAAGGACGAPRDCATGECMGGRCVSCSTTSPAWSAPGSCGFFAGALRTVRLTSPTTLDVGYSGGDGDSCTETLTLSGASMTSDGGCTFFGGVVRRLRITGPTTLAFEASGPEGDACTETLTFRGATVSSPGACGFFGGTVRSLRVAAPTRLETTAYDADGGSCTEAFDFAGVRTCG